MTRPPFEYATLAEEGVGFHVVIRRPGSPWLQVVATFPNQHRAKSYCDVENDMAADEGPWHGDESAPIPTTPEPASAIPALMDMVDEVGRLQEDVLWAREMGLKEGRAEMRQAVLAELNEQRAEVTARIAVEPAPESPSPIAIVPPKPAPIPPPQKPAAVVSVPRLPPDGPSDRQRGVAELQKIVVADLDALMKAFPLGPTTRDLHARYGGPEQWLGEALRQAAAAKLIRYEADGRGPDGKVDPNKRVRPLDWFPPKTVERKAVAVPVATPAPSKAEPPASPKEPLAERIMSSILSQFDRLGAFTIAEMARLLGEAMTEIRVACEELDAAGRAKFVTIDRAKGRQLVPLTWRAPAAPLVVSPAAQALASFQRDRTAPKVHVEAVEKRASFGETGAVSLGYKPDAPIESRNVDVLTSGLLGDPAPNRSALASHKPAPAPTVRRHDDEPMSLEDVVRRGGRV